MKLHPRIRKTIKWGGAAVTVVLIAAWVASGWWGLAYAGPCWTGNESFAVGFESGMYRVSHAWGNGALAYPYGWSINQAEYPWTWWFHRWSSGRGWTVEVPLWLPVCLAAFIAFGGWRSEVHARARERTGCCIRCGYDRAGLAPDAVCPECGTLSKP